jgi:hypothetical protein
MQTKFEIIESNFVPYQIALDMKSIWFDEHCIATIDQTDFIHILGTKKLPRGSMVYDIINCPTFSQSFKWFRQKYGLLHPIIEYNTDGSLIIEIRQNKINFNLLFINETS